MEKEFEPPRLIILVGAVDAAMVEKTAGLLSGLNALSNGPIDVHLTSGGGGLDYGMAIHDMLKFSAAPITVKVFGCCDSAAVLILQAAKTRLIAPHATMLLHKGHLTIDAQLEKDELARFTDMSRRNDDRYSTTVASRAGLSRSKVSDMCKKNTTLDAQDVLRLGLADGIIGLRLPHKKR